MGLAARPNFRSVCADLSSMPPCSNTKTHAAIQLGGSDSTSFIAGLNRLDTVAIIPIDNKLSFMLHRASLQVTHNTLSTLRHLLSCSSSQRTVPCLRVWIGVGLSESRDYHQLQKHCDARIQRTRCLDPPYCVWAVSARGFFRAFDTNVLGRLRSRSEMNDVDEPEEPRTVSGHGPPTASYASGAQRRKSQTVASSSCTARPLSDLAPLQFLQDAAYSENTVELSLRFVRRTEAPQCVISTLPSVSMYSTPYRVLSRPRRLRL
ncbi:hypothetical protein B0H16DRAFT_832418 [Mycena metata]|uniref:Uncharacterized protein n=1 Tax=Mycena metata TaxID=1033252 RepID=A0AAD7N9X7_9AGAR|nr:hypothetical protein B0H16DRAFT_832418 [Mycena metata]